MFKSRILTLFIVLAFLSCEVDDNNTNLVVRSILESKLSGGISAKVYLEGENGYAINGALVYILTPNNEMNLLNFDNSLGCYNTHLALVQSGTYSVIVRSRAYPEITQDIPYQNLGVNLDIITLQDNTGSDALMGDNLNTNSDVLISWSSIDSVDVYKVKITKPDYTESFFSTEETSILIDSLEVTNPGNYGVQITAQYISGDPLFINSDFYAVNEISSSMFYFQVE